MYASNYRFSAALALTVHTLAAAGIGGVLARSPATTPPQPTVITVMMAGDAKPTPTAAEGDPFTPRSVELPRPQHVTAARTPSAGVPSNETAHETVTDARVTLAGILPSAPLHGPTGNPKTVFLASLGGIPDGAAAAHLAGAGQAAGNPAGTGGGVSTDAMPAPRTAIRPQYPIGARRRGEAGQVILDVEVADDGRAGQVTLVAPSGFTDLDQAAEHAVRRTLFRPALRGGQPVAARVHITILFRLTD